MVVVLEVDVVTAVVESIVIGATVFVARVVLVAAIEASFLAVYMESHTGTLVIRLWYSILINVIMCSNYNKTKLLTDWKSSLELEGKFGFKLHGSRKCAILV